MFPTICLQINGLRAFLAGWLCYRHIYSGLRKISVFQIKMTPLFQRYPRWISFFMENCSLSRFFHEQTCSNGETPG